MEKINVSFKGMTNIPDDSFSGDGETAVVLNMRHKGGELVQCQPPAATPVSYKVRQAMFHAKSGKWLELREDNSLWLRDGTEAIQADVVSFAIMGNVVIMYREKMKPCYLIWRGTEYVNLGQMPEPPKLELSRKDRTFSFTTKEKYPASIMLALEDDGLENYAGYVKKGFIDSCLSEVYNQKGFVDNALFRVCYRLFDGSCIASDIYSVNNDVMSFNFAPATEGGVINSNRLYYTASVKYFNVDILLKDFVDIEEWKDVITGIEVYTSGSIMNHKPVAVSYLTDEYKGAKNVYAQYDIYEMRTLEEMRNEIMNAEFHRYMSFDLKGELIATHLDKTSPSDVTTQLLLKDIVSMHSETGSVGVYNSRLHTDGGRILYDGYRNLNRESGAITEMVTITEINRIYRVVTKEEWKGGGLTRTAILMYPDSRAEKMTLAYKKGGNYYKKVFDLRAHPYENAAIYINQGEDRTKKFSKSVSDTNWADGSSAGCSVDAADFYFPEIENGITYLFNYDTQQDLWCIYKDSTLGTGPLMRKGRLDEFGIKQSGTIAKGSSFKVNVLYLSGRGGYAIKSLSAFTEISEKEYLDIKELEVVNYESANDVLKVSAVDNPFYFPSAQTYRFDAEIVGMASNSEAISTGQFGQYPLFVFTKSGIWAMGVDASGQGAYTTMSPFSREVCSGEICPVSGGVVFTAKRGLMAISGGAVTELSAMVDGRRLDFFSYNQEMWNAIFGKADVGVIAPDEIRTYIDGAKLGYNYLHNEVIVSNSNYGYSFVFSLSTQLWSVIDSVFDVTTNSYPELVVYDNKNLKRLNFKNEVPQFVSPVNMARIGDAIGGGVIEINTGVPSVVAVTRPIKMGTLDFKRLRQAALRCTFTGALNFYVLGSIDGAGFVPIAGKEYQSVNGNELANVTRRDLITSMSRSKQYKYFVIAVAGKMKGRVSMAELLVDGSFTGNKLR